MKIKVKEITPLVKNHWKAKQEVLDKFGLPRSHDEVRRPRGIVTFFSEQSLPPVAASMNTSKSSPQPILKTNFQVS